MPEHSDHINNSCINNDNTAEISTTVEKPANPTNGKRYKRTPPEIFAQIKTEYENNANLPDLAKKYQIDYYKLYRHMKRDCWQKGKNLPKLHLSIAEKNHANLVKQGITDDKAMQLLARGMTEPVILIFEGKGEAMQANTVPDYKTRLEYLKERNKLVAAYPKEDPKEADKHLHFHFDAESAKSKSAEQIITEYQRTICGH